MKFAGDFTEMNASLQPEEKMQLAYVVLTKLISHFHQKADRSKRLYELYKYGSIVLAALTTIISALQVIYPAQFPKWILPVASAGATVAVAFLGASGVQKIWVHSRTTQKNLQTEEFLFNQQAGRYSNIPDETAIKIFSERLVQLWNEGHQQWEQHVGDE
jgi:hypothetical protein